ncbi:hypothetical protein SAMD00019534_115590 [Acytostelium subglobosum LB1]|uniref:hypothetical protein n=1 Tax=Acytostelium subglobosum LB1 TaxID=1410327 RepID=UPI0006448CF1|nr:hypothetical protein SAMD00019534_115590 [Acytostelium subglobosum LB1]GAM28383.1 hypothetical protein SAMD00019534_115590 [Acytostelium subglobosum LB1]|eukprot:XP_012748700.1 hypothetical protein SAMD00019534_115590 [Acytostelium subglobosum LB1]
MSMNDGEKNFKVVILGEGCVGKTSLIQRYTQNNFSDKYMMTPSAGYSQKMVNMSGKRVCLTIWDTAGQDRFHALGPIYYRDSQGAIIVYDITDGDSFIKAKTWMKEIKTQLGSAIQMCLVGNKSDLERARVVQPEEAESYAASVGALHYTTSAKLNKGVEELFLDLTKRMFTMKPLGSDSKPTCVIQVIPETTDKKTSPCC